MRTPAMFVALLLVVAAVAPASALVTSDPSASPSTAPATAVAAAERPADIQSSGEVWQTTDGEPARTIVEIDLQSDRSAEWRVETRYVLETENETRAFRDLAERYEAGEADAGPSAVLFESLQERAQESTGRSMAIENVSYHSAVDAAAGRGTLAITFRWTNFLRQGANDTLLLDDVFTLPTAESDDQRTWLSIFDDEQEIIIRPPDGYTVTGTSIPVQQRESAIVLVEPSDFEGEDGALEITYSSVGPAGQLPLGFLAGGGLIVILVALGGIWLLQRRDDRSLPWESPAGSRESSDGAAADAADGGPTPQPTDSTDDVGDATDSAAQSSSGASVTDGNGGAAADEPDLSLLSDEERVEQLLERNGGRMKQASIVDETDWSDAKVSQLLSAMADDGRVNKLRLGRENLISLPDEDDAPSGAGDAAEE